ncbi:helix-turn-helix transcriptional regulator [Sulfurimonas paralvinellae]|uniref:Helix-turn-helix transcriptional regulator n=2 Tax=Sulfurimonas paralvinellae TaxID=317658 RepID=A0A7M1B6P0_9BACT|nr:helix-turn-helix transcriptional regulator [Sulfurimonas paralvinellae]
MESFFFNITDASYKVTMEYENQEEYVKRVDISNGIVFYDIFLNSFGANQSFDIKNLDRLVAIIVVNQGNISLLDNISETNYLLKENTISIFESSRQNFSFMINSKIKIFAIFIADFILKRYLSSDKNEVIDFLYANIQDEVSCMLVDVQPIDALSLYIIEKILYKNEDNFMKSIKCEHSILEFMIHRFSLIDRLNDTLDIDEKHIAKSARDILLKNYMTPPHIKELAHLCATNETKLKQIFKKAYKTTIYAYIQKLRLEKANLLLRDKLCTIGEVAKEVGYKHQGNFSKRFFEYYGVYPKELLKK